MVTRKFLSEVDVILLYSQSAASSLVLDRSWRGFSIEIIFPGGLEQVEGHISLLITPKILSNLTT